MQGALSIFYPILQSHAYYFLALSPLNVQEEKRSECMLIYLIALSWNDSKIRRIRFKFLLVIFVIHYYKK